MTSQYFFPHIYHLELELTEYQGIGQYPGSQSCSQPRSTFAKRRLSFSLQRLQLQILPGAPKKGQGDNLSRSKVPLHGCCADPRPGSGHLRRAWSRRFRWPGVTAIKTITIKMAIILPTGTGQWYAPPAVINDARYCMALHGIAWYCMVSIR